MTSTRTHAAKIHHLATHAVARDLRHNIVVADRVMTRAELEAAEEERHRSAVLSKRSLRRSAKWISDMLSIACLDHGAGKDEFCWPSCGGICKERVYRATVDLERRPVHMSAASIGSRR